MSVLKRAVQCPDCKRVYSGPPQRYSVDGTSRVYFLCACGRADELVGELRLREAPQAQAGPSQVSQLLGLFVPRKSFPEPGA